MKPDERKIRFCAFAVAADVRLCSIRVMKRGMKSEPRHLGCYSLRTSQAEFILLREPHGPPNFRA